MTEDERGARLLGAMEVRTRRTVRRLDVERYQGAARFRGG
jgi:hypothetical protein